MLDRQILNYFDPHSDGVVVSGVLGIFLLDILEILHALKAPVWPREGRSRVPSCCFSSHTLGQGTFILTEKALRFGTLTGREFPSVQAGLSGLPVAFGRALREAGTGGRGGGGRGGERGRQNEEAGLPFPRPTVCRLETVTSRGASERLAHGGGVAGPFLLFPSHLRRCLSHLSGNISSCTSEP